MKEHYERLYKQNDSYWGSKPSPVTLLLLAHAKSGKLLDLGCGQGPDAVFLHRRGFTVTAIDISPTAVAQLKSIAVDIDAREHDMRELLPGPFDVIFSRMALQMVPPPERISYIHWLKSAYPHALHAHVIPIAGACFGDSFVCASDMLKVAYNDWQLLFYEEAWTIGRAPNKKGEPYLMREARIIAKAT